MSDDLLDRIDDTLDDYVTDWHGSADSARWEGAPDESEWDDDEALNVLGAVGMTAAEAAVNMQRWAESAGPHLHIEPPDDSERAREWADEVNRQLAWERRY